MRICFHVTAGPLVGQMFAFDRHDIFLVGRSPNAHCRLPEDDPYFSRVHFLIEVNPPRCRLTDMGSRNGTFVNGRKVEAIELRHGDVIKAGHTLMRVEFQRTADDPVPAETETEVAGATKVDIFIPEGVAPELPLSDPSSSTITSQGEDLRILNADAAADTELLFPATSPPRIPNYQILRELGRGNMGVVYLARSLKTGNEVALKVILPHEADNPLTVQRFLREAEVLGQLDHPNIVKFLETGQAGKILFFAMEYVRGTDVAKVMKERPRFEPRTGVRLAIQVLDALAHAHSKGMVHRDIKPANVLLAELEDGKRQVKLADFGLARVYRASQLSGLTLHGDLGGTPAYMAPEQITNYRDVTPAADQYSVAAMLYHMLTGCYILDLPPMPAGLLVILQKEPIPLLERRPDLAEGLGPVIHKALSKKPADRYPDVVAFRQALVPFGK
jgi:pSer/pThr/pTyr-binding forkhead associated (FHA) protein